MPTIQFDLVGPRSPSPEEETFPWVAAVSPSSETAADSNMNQRIITVIPEEDSAHVTQVQPEKPKKKARKVRMRYKSDDEEERKEASFGDVISHLLLFHTSVVFYFLFVSQQFIVLFCAMNRAAIVNMLSFDSSFYWICHQKEFLYTIDLSMDVTVPLTFFIMYFFLTSAYSGERRKSRIIIVATLFMKSN